MRLLLTSTAYPPFIGGAQLLMHQLARHMVRRHNVQVVTQWDERRTDWLLGSTLRAPREPRAYEIDGVPVWRLALGAAARRRLLPWVGVYYLLQGPALKRIAAELARLLADRAAQADLIHNYRIGREGLSYASWQAARERGVPFVFTPVHHTRWNGWLYRYYHSLYRQADAVIALTEAERRLLVRLGVAERRIFVTGMGPVLAESWSGRRFRERYGLGEAPLVLFLGQKYAYKGLALLLQAARLVWRRYPETRFAFIGPRTSYSRRLFARESDARILELDAVTLEEKTDALAACDIFCLPSTQESFGGVFTEAWSLGKPVVGCAIPAVSEVIDDGRDGLLCVPRAAEVAERLIYLLERPGERERLGQCGLAKVNARYSWPRLAEQTEQIYRQVLGG